MPRNPLQVVLCREELERRPLDPVEVDPANPTPRWPGRFEEPSEGLSVDVLAAPHPVGAPVCDGRVQRLPVWENIVKLRSPNINAGLNLKRLDIVLKVDILVDERRGERPSRRPPVDWRWLGWRLVFLDVDWAAGHC